MLHKIGCLNGSVSVKIECSQRAFCGSACYESSFCGSTFFGNIELVDIVIQIIYINITIGIKVPKRPRNRIQSETKVSLWVITIPKPNFSIVIVAPSTGENISANTSDRPPPLKSKILVSRRTNSNRVSFVTRCGSKWNRSIKSDQSLSLITVVWEIPCWKLNVQ